tara:strand:+ start:314 stop:1324 length:1011 start_codon:yes stop_codon:yes gene_type:complete
MAISTAANSPKEFQFLIAEQDTFGTFETTNNMHALDVDSVGTPSLNPTQVLDVRNGSRVLQKEDFFQDVKASVKELSVSGTATTNALDLLLENITGEAEGSAGSIYSFASDQATTNVGVGSTSQAGTLLSIVITSAGNDADLAFKDCVCTSLTLNADTGTEGGRIKFSATFQTGSAVEDLTDAATTVDTTFAASENYFMTNFSAGYRKIYGVDDLIMSSFSMTMENPAVFTGVTSTGYEVISRAGEFSVTLDATVKYDGHTRGSFERFNNQTQEGATAAQPTLLNHQLALAADNFGISIPKTVLTNVSFNEADVMMLDLSVKGVGDGSNPLVEVSC